MKKTFFITVLFALIAGVASAQTNLGVDYYALGEYDAAKSYFEKNINNAPAESYFYLGEIAFKQGKLDEAKAYYQKGLEANHESLLNQVGLIKLTVKADPKTAEKELKNIQKKARKDVEALIAVSHAYLDNGMLDLATAAKEEAKKRFKKSPEVYILEGDVLKASGGPEKLGDAAARYEMSNTFDPNFRLGYVKSAQAYENINPRYAIDLLKRVIELHPDYLIAYRNLGKIYVATGNYNEAIETYKKHFAGGQYTIDDIERFARAYYFTAQYNEAKKLVEEGLKIAPNHYVLNRYNMYIEADQHNPYDGIPAAEKFFSISHLNPRISSDYTKYASLLEDEKRYNEALAEYEKAIAIDTAAVDIYKEASDLAKRKGDYGLSAEYYAKYMKAAGNYDARDLNVLLFSYYNAGTQSVNDSLLVQELKNDGVTINKLNLPQVVKDSIVTDSTDSIFKKHLANYYLSKADEYADSIIARLPESYSGYRWKALTKHAIDPVVENGAAKPYYELVVQKIVDRQEEDGVSPQAVEVLKEAYNYLGYYYYLISDNANSVIYWNKLLEIDPENRNAKLVLDALSKEKKK